MIEIENLRLVIEGKDVLKGVDLHLEAGDVYGLLGPNGAGKFTTMYALLGLRSYAGGLVSVLGNDPAVDPIPIRRQVGGMSEKAGFYEWMTALDYANRLAHAVDKGRRLPLVVSVTDRRGKRVLTSRTVQFHVRRKPMLHTGRVLSVAAGAPLLFLGLLVGLKWRRRALHNGNAFSQGGF
ncbi:MAG: type transport system ATP-binding protein [Desulfovibrionales bacterium]|nr:type transport system ATP-binding protein [Desulfovibrionales bacterium]